MVRSAARGACWGEREPRPCCLTEFLPSSRVGLDWACSMAEILRSLSGTPRWRDVIATFTDHCVKQLPFQLKHTNVFTLLVLVGFPQVHGSEAGPHLPVPWPPCPLCAQRGLGTCLWEGVFFHHIVCIYSIGVFPRLWDGLFVFLAV